MTKKFNLLITIILMMVTINSCKKEEKNQNRDFFETKEAKRYFDLTQMDKIIYRDEGNECTGECGIEGIYMHLNWDGAEYNSTYNSISVPITRSNLSYFSPAADLNSFPSNQDRKSEAVFFKSTTGIISMYIYKMAGTEKYCETGNMTKNSYCNIDSLFEGLIGYYTTEDSLIQLYRVENKQIYFSNIANNTDSLQQVVDRGCTNYIIQYYPCTSGEGHNCQQSCDCQVTISTCYPPTCIWGTVCDGITYSGSLSTGIPSTAGNYGYPISPPNNNGSSTGGGVINNGTGIINNGGGTTNNGNEPSTGASLTNASNPHPELSVMMAQINAFKLKYGIDLLTIEEDIADNCFGNNSAAQASANELCAVSALIDNLNVSLGLTTQQSKFLIQIRGTDLYNSILNLGQTNNFSPVVVEHLKNEINSMRLDPNYKEFVESSFIWPPIVWEIAKELIGEKVVDIIFRFIPGFGQANNVKDAVKAIASGDWVDFTFQVGQIVVSNTPLGQLLKAWEAAHEVQQLYKWVDRIWDVFKNLPPQRLDRAWNILKNTTTKFSEKALKYVDDVRTPMLGGYFATISTYSSKFKSQFPELAGQIGEVHHAVPQKVLNKYPNLGITNDMMHSFENLRGIPSNGTLDHTTITNYWEGFFNTHPNATIQDVIGFSKYIDDEFGHLFVPPVR